MNNAVLFKFFSLWTTCRRQEKEGWYVKDCIETQEKRPCLRCKRILELKEALGQ